MFRKIISIIVILTFLTGVIGCASIPQENKGAATGAGIGAATGVVAGALLASSGAKTEMAIIGGLIGALAGGLIGHYGFDKKKSKEETDKKYKYNPKKGMMVRIEDASVHPVSAKPGDKIELRMTYAVLGVPAGAELQITETREIRSKDDIYGKPEVTTFREDGTYYSSIPITLPSDAKKGTYKVIMTVKSPNASDSKETTFSVRK